MRSVLVFGAAGRLGSRILRVLRERGVLATAVVRRADALVEGPGRPVVVADGRRPPRLEARYDAAVAALPVAALPSFFEATHGRAAVRVAVVPWDAALGALPGDALILRAGDVLGDGLWGVFRPWIASLRPDGPAAPADGSRILRPVHARDVADLAAELARLGGAGVVDAHGGEERPADEWRARAAAALAALGVPVRPTPRPASEPPTTAPAVGRATAEFGWRPRRVFETAFSERLAAAP